MNEAFSKAAARIQHTYYTPREFCISLWQFLECIWLCGIIINLWKLYLSTRDFKRYIIRHGVNVTSKEPYHLCLSKIAEGRIPKLQVYLVPGLKIPQQSGFFHPKILLPTGMNLTETQLYYALCHEAEHVRKKDALIKFGTNILKALYWWNPFIYLLSKQIDTTIEFRVDSKFAPESIHTKKEYVNTLMHVAVQAKKLTECGQPQKEDCILLNSLSVPITGGSMKDMEMRLPMIYEQKKPFVPLTAILMALVLTLYASSYLYIFEAYYVSDTAVTEASGRELTPDEMHAVELENGTYDIYWKDIKIDHSDSLEYYPLVPVTNK
ncbi:MAG: M56 family metallopeptidase [Acetatifactor sp.]